MNKRNDLRKKIIYVLLFVFVVMVSLTTYLIITDKKVLKNNSPESIEPPIEVIPEITHTNMEVSYFENLLDIINISYLNDGFNSIEDLNNQDKLKLLFLANNSYIKNLDKVTGQQVNNYFKKYYNTTVINENINCNDEYCYIYNEENDEYIEGNIDNNILNEYINRKVYSKTTNYEQSNNTYTITKYELYQPLCIECMINTKYYASMKDALNDTNLLIEVPSEYTNDEIENYNNQKIYSLVFETNFLIYKNIIPYNVYTFKKVNDNYVLASYTINRLD